ncbi:MAG: hypothetical protein A3B68_05310 [Candidatus Melainabacteria bacterium RIFCSPHIGHO2_02_FULL_34_12]|nr:MAG: hypothetical protein A3B68_05310 [Candidatus Melainabacteria bacterium RIFCSPHIGHO2_02_FULL_34_12]
MKKYFSTIFVVLFFGLSSFYLIHAEESKPLLHFVQISDIHLQQTYAKDSTRLLGSSQKLFKDAVSQINKIKNLDFVLGTGDLVDVPEESLVNKFIEIAKELKYPFYAVLGNHDVGVNTKLNKQKFIQKFSDLKGARSFTGSMSYYSFCPNDKFAIVCLDGTTEKTVTSHGQIDDEQLKWLKNELTANENKFVIIALHFPVIQPYKSDTHFIFEPDRTRLLEIIENHKNVIGVFTGHYHAARLTKVKNRIHNSCPAVVQYPNAFREIIITQDGDNPKYLKLTFKWHEVDGKELRDVSKNGSDAWALTQGTPEDRENVIKVRVY